MRQCFGVGVVDAGIATAVAAVAGQRRFRRLRARIGIEAGQGNRPDAAWSRIGSVRGPEEAAMPVGPRPAPG